MRIVFMGTAPFSVPTLDALVTAGHDVVAVYSQPSRRAGRGKLVTPSPVALRAAALRLSVSTPVTLRDSAAQAAFAALGADVAVVAAYGLILPPAILSSPRLGCLNVHASLLPRWRGAAPVQRAILAGDEMTGVAIMQMEAGLDTGPFLLDARTPIDRKTAGMLSRELAQTGAALMIQVLADVAAYPARPQQILGVTYAAKIEKAEARIDFARRAAEVERQVRAFHPVPGAWFDHAGERIRVLQVDPVTTDPATIGQEVDPGTVIAAPLTIACRDGAVAVRVLQRAGRAVMTPEELLRGFAIPIGTRIA